MKSLFTLSSNILLLYVSKKKKNVIPSSARNLLFLRSTGTLACAPHFELRRLSRRFLFTNT
jgi:hypothetical protein